MTVKLIGNLGSTGTTPGGANYLLAYKFTASASGSCSEIKVVVGSSVNVKFAIYADSSGSPGSRLAKQDTGQACTTGTNTLSLEAACSLVNGTDYWIIINSDAQQVYFEADAAYDNYNYVAKTYSGYTWPATLSESWTNYPNLFMRIEGWGTLATQTITPSGITSALAFGTAKITLYLLPTGKASGLTFGTATVATSAVVIYPSGRSSTVAFGTPSLKYNQVLHPSPRAPAAVFGTPSFATGNITCTGIVSAAALGAPTVARFVFHVILEAKYSAEAPDINRAYIIGQDSTGVDVTGAAITQADVDLVGERLEVRHEISVPTAAVASAVAAAVLAAARMDGKSGRVIIPPHCGLELWDVLSFYDAVANQSTAYRVSAYVFEYDTRQGIYRHTLDLCAP